MNTTTYETFLSMSASPQEIIEARLYHVKSYHQSMKDKELYGIIYDSEKKKNYKVTIFYMDQICTCTCGRCGSKFLCCLHTLRLLLYRMDWMSIFDTLPEYKPLNSHSLNHHSHTCGCHLCEFYNTPSIHYPYIWHRDEQGILHVVKKTIYSC